MVEPILAGFTKDVVKSLADLATNEIAKVLCVKNEINKLKSKLETIRAVSRDAEKTVAQYETTRDWLKQLREITYEIENIIDRCRIEEERLQTAHPQYVRSSRVRRSRRSSFRSSSEISRSSSL